MACQVTTGKINGCTAVSVRMLAAARAAMPTHARRTIVAGTTGSSGPAQTASPLALERAGNISSP